MSADRAIVCAPLVPVRAEPSHRAERVTDWVLGEAVERIERKDDWVRTRGPDGYVGWVPAGPFEGEPPMPPEEWERAATLFSLGTPVAHGSLDRIPWGGRVVPTQGGVILPDGQPAEPELATRLIRPPDPESVNAFVRVDRVRTAALDWIGVPYVWGGRTELGVDCSGFVQAVFAAAGSRLPRDSGDQAEVGPARPEGPAEAGDLLFFAPEGAGITHVALSLGGDVMIHAAASVGRVAIGDLAGPAAVERRLAGSLVRRPSPLADAGS
ncbi:MAG: SH3 domain-containing C40 family peptidase [Gemmatimonadota bacterium]|nr:SH3 domain-containing C40 family peptidase [Gemmatimonadota bacterium]